MVYRELNDQYLGDQYLGIGAGRCCTHLGVCLPEVKAQTRRAPQRIWVMLGIMGIKHVNLDV